MRSSQNKLARSKVAKKNWLDAEQPEEKWPYTGSQKKFRCRVARKKWLYAGQPEKTPGWPKASQKRAGYPKTSQKRAGWPKASQKTPGWPKASQKIAGWLRSSQKCLASQKKIWLASGWWRSHRKNAVRSSQKTPGCDFGRFFWSPISQKTPG